MNNRTYVYEIVVAPDVNDNTVRPIDLLNTFLKSTSQQAMLLSFVPQYITTYTSTTREIIPAKPRSRAPPVVIAASHDTVTVQAKMWEQAYVYAVILPNPTNQTISSQVIKGLNTDNTPVVNQSYVAILSDQSGTANLTFTLLKENTSYTVFISAECVLPFTPRLAFNNTDVISVQAQTQLNLNLMKNEKQVVKVLEDYDPKFAEEVRIHREKVMAAVKVTGADKNQRRRNRS
jgi:hypothetical protein